MVHMALLDQLVQVAHREVLELQDPQAQLEELVPQDQPDRQGQPVQLVQLVKQEVLVQLVQPDRQVYLEQQEQLVQMDKQEELVPLVRLEEWAQQVLQAVQENLEQPGLPDFLVNLELLELLVQMEVLVRQGQRVLLEVRGQLEQLA